MRSGREQLEEAVGARFLPCVDAGEQQPAGRVGILPAVFAHARGIGADIAGVEAVFVEGRRQQLDKAVFFIDELFPGRVQRPGDARGVEAGERRPRLTDGVDAAGGRGGRAQFAALVVVGAQIPVSVPAKLLHGGVHLRREGVEIRAVGIVRGDLGVVRRGHGEKLRKPDALPLPLRADAVHAVVPVARAHEGEAVFAGEAGAQAKGAHAVVVERAHFLRDLGGTVPVGLALGDGHVAQVGDALAQHPRVAGEAHVGCRRIRQKEAVVRDARAHAGTGHVPPVQNVAGGKLPRRAEQEVFTGMGGLKVHEQEHVLQLVAEAIGAACLIEPGAGADAGVERLLDEPRKEAVESLVAGLDAQGVQARLPRFLRFRQRRGAFAQHFDGFEGVLAAPRPAGGETELRFPARRQKEARFQRPAALAAALFKEAVRSQNAAVAEKGRALRARFRRGVECGEVADARHRAARQTDAVLVPCAQPCGVARVHTQKPVDKGSDGALAVFSGQIAHRDFDAEGVCVRADIERCFKAQSVRAAQKAGTGQRVGGAEGRAGRFAGQKARVCAPALVGEIEHQAPALAQRVVVKWCEALHAAVAGKEKAAAALGDEHAEVLSRQHVRPCGGGRLGGVDGVAVLREAAIAVEEGAPDGRQLY